MVMHLENIKKNVVIKVEIPEEDYKILSKIAKSKGYTLTNDYIREILIDAAEKGENMQLNKESIDQLSRKIEKTVQDLLNPFTQKIDELSSRIADLIESIEKDKEEKEEKPSPKEQKEEEIKTKKKTAIDILKEQGVIFSSEVQWLRNPDAYFKKLESSGAVVLYLDNERIALDREYWNRFKAKLDTIAIKDPKEVEELIMSEFGENGGKLFNILVKKGVVYYDEDLKAWTTSNDM